MPKSLFVLSFFLITNTLFAYEIFPYRKDNWQYFKGFPSLALSQPFIINKNHGSIGVIAEEINPNTNETLGKKCDEISKKNKKMPSYCKITKKDEVSFLFAKKYETAMLYQIVIFKKQPPQGIIEFEEGLK